MPRLATLLLAVAALAAPSVALGQASASLQVQVTVVQPPSFLRATTGPAAGTGLGFRLVGAPNCAVSAAVDGAPVPLGPCAPAGLLTAAAQLALGRAARAGKAVVVTMTIDAGT